MDKNSDESVKAQRQYMSSAEESGGDEGDDEAEVGKGERGRDDAEEEEVSSPSKLTTSELCLPFC